MASYRIIWKISAKKELKKLPTQFIKKIIEVIEGLQLEPLPKGVKKLTGSENSFRIRVGNYRVVYNLYQKKVIIEIIRVRHRKDAYNK